jgi:hypothetical protein
MAVIYKKYALKNLEWIKRESASSNASPLLMQSAARVKPAPRLAG